MGRCRATEPSRIAHVAHSRFFLQTQSPMRLATSGEQGGIAGIPIQRQLKSTGDGNAQAFVQCVAVAATKFVIASNGWRERSPFGFHSSAELLSTRDPCAF